MHAINLRESLRGFGYDLNMKISDEQQNEEGILDWAKTRLDNIEKQIKQRKKYSESRKNESR